MISRFSRLYPAYWVCLIITSLVIWFFGQDLFIITGNQVFFNFTMLQGFFKIPHVDGVYWSLLVELKFYILMGILLLFNKIKYVEWFALFLLAIAVLYLFLPFENAPFLLRIIYYFTFPEWNAYFVAGMFFFLIWKNNCQKLYWHHFAIIACLIISIINALEMANRLEENFHTAFLDPMVIAIVVFGYFTFFLIAERKMEVLNKKAFLSIGVLTYPLYLIHQNIGYIILNKTNGTINKWVVLLLLLLLMTIAAHLIAKYLEKPMGKGIRAFMSLKMNRQTSKLN